MGKWSRYGVGIGIAVLMLVLFSLVSASASEKGNDPSSSVLVRVADVPMPGPAVRFDYQSLDAGHHRLYISHMDANRLIVFDTQTRSVVANLSGFNQVHGVLAVPEIERVYASATGRHQVVAVDMRSLKTIGAAGPIDYPDGLAYAPSVKRVFVSDEHGGVDAVIDATTNRLLTKIPLGGGAGNTVYGTGSGQILVAVHHLNEVVTIDPATMKISGRYKLTGLIDPHGIVLDQQDRLAFIAGEANHALAVFDLKTKKVLSVHQVGDDPDVLAFDLGFGLLYVAAESGTVTVFRLTGRTLRLLGRVEMPHAHTVAVDPSTHLVYFPLQDVDGHPVLRIMRPADLQ